MSLTNAQIGELLMQRGDEVDDAHRARAYRRAGRAAYITWTEEVADLVAAGRSPSELPQIGDRLAARIEGWLADPPEVEFDATRAGFLTRTEVEATLAENPEWRAALRGDLQMHTVGSDGHETVEAMARNAVNLGYSFIAITDHTEGLKIAGGMDETAFAEQGVEIDALNAKLADEGVDLMVLKGAEMNLDEKGAGDMEAGFLATLDIVLGAFHSSLRIKDDQTKRYVGALSNPSVHVLAHPRARMYTRRVGLQADWDMVVAAAATTGKALEIDSHPNRQDLNVAILERVAEAGATVSIGTDAHDTNEMLYIGFGLAAAIRAGIERDRILNYWSSARLVEWTAEVTG